MSWNNRVVWSEGMFIATQHFQQHDRYLENLIDARSRPLSAAAWGFSELSIDSGLLTQGKLAIISARGLLPDGTPFNIPQDDLAPSPLSIDDELRDSVVYLALPLKRAGQRDTVDEGDEPGGARFVSRVSEVRDDNALFESRSPVATGSRALRLLTEKDGLNDYAVIGVAQVREKDANLALTLDDGYIPPVLDVSVSRSLTAFRNELLGLLRQRAEALADRVVASGTGGASEIANFMLLQLVNRSEPLIRHLSQLSPLHPERLFSELVSLAGEFATFSTPERRPQASLPYRHDDLASSFAPVIQALRESLSMLIDSKATPIAIAEKAYGIHVAILPDRTLIDSASFILVVRADMPGETLRGRFSQQSKIGPVEHIRNLVNLQLPGIGLLPLPVAPRQIPFHAGSTYFELDRGSEHWKQLSHSGGFAFHIAGEFPGLNLTFWAIRG
jgi:type VI secretion system protein ImpJ